MKLPTTTHRYPLIILIIAALIVFGWFVVFALRTSRIDAAAEFDHSHCQYPERTTNPPNGCDNTDPCDPANAAKGGSGDCSDKPQEVPVSHNTPILAPPVEGKRCE